MTTRPPVRLNFDSLAAMKEPLSALSVDYGIQCSAADEKQLVKNVNAFLASLNYRKMYQLKDTSIQLSIQPPERTLRFSHYYRQFLKTAPRWYFDLMPNVDLDGKTRFPDHLDCGWTLFTHKPFPQTYSAQDHDTLNSFFAQLLHALGFPTKVLHVYEKGEERL
jgi:hypothetical protein